MTSLLLKVKNISNLRSPGRTHPLALNMHMDWCDIVDMHMNWR